MSYTMRQLYSRLFNYIKPFWVIFLISVVANAGYSAVDAAMVKLMQPLIDDVFVKRDQGMVRLIPLLLPLAFLVRGVMSFTSDYGMAYISRRVVTTLRQQMFRRLQRLPATYYDQSSSGQILAKLTYNVDQVAKASTDVIVDVVRNSLLLVFLIGVMLWTSWRLTLVFLVVCPIVVLLFTKASKRFRKISHSIQDSIAKVTHIAEENIEGYQVVRTYGGQAYENKMFESVTESNRRLEMKMIVTKSISQPLIQCTGGIGLAMTVFMATSDYSPESLTAGAFATLMTAMVAMLNPIKQLTSISNKVQQGMAGAESIFAVLDEPIEQDQGHRTLRASKGHLEFNDVSFSYGTTQNEVLKHISLVIEPGEVVAFVGRSGAGKSTLTNLLLRFYDDYQGTIKLDGVDIKEFTLESLRSNFAFVSQQVMLFNDTVAHNIAYGQPNASLEQIKAAARAANAIEFIEKLPLGFETPVGENGVLLSGGQRQRIAIARAICKDAPLLIMDEATSALDTASEYAVQSAIDRLMREKTSIVIAHRLSTIEKADKIVVLDGGEVVETGTHQQLLAQNGHYAKLHANQDELEPDPAVTPQSLGSAS